MEIKCRNEREREAVARDRRDKSLWKQTVAPIHPSVKIAQLPGAPSLPAQLTDWLAGQQWDTFATFTFGKYEASPRAARAAMERLFTRFPVRLAWWVTERGEKFGRVHNHALVYWRPGMEGDRVTADVIASNVESWWRKRAGFAQLDPYDPTRGAAGYLASYVTKKVVEYDLWLPPTR